MAITVEKLYEICDVIDNAAKKSDHQAQYVSILSAVKSKGSNEKRLATQLISRYFQEFPDLRDQSLDAIFELCENEDVNIRKLVIKDLPLLCKGGGPHVTKIADILIQLLQTDDHQEQQIVQNSLFSLLKAHPKDTLAAFYGHILAIEDDLIRERGVKFLACKLKVLPEDILDKQLEEHILNETKKVLQDVSGDEFVLFMHILSNLKHLQTVSGRQMLLDIVTEQADLEKPFQADDPDRIDQLIQCMKQATQFLSKNVNGSKFLSYSLTNILPALASIPSTNENDSSSMNTENKKEITNQHEENPRLELLRLTTDLSDFYVPTATNDSQLETKNISTVFDKLLEFLPTPPSKSNGETPSDVISAENLDQLKIQFSEIECLIWILHNLTKKSPEFFTQKNVKPELEERFKEFRQRLQYLARVIQIYSRKLSSALNGKSKEELKKAENKIKFIALKTTLNISNALKDFLHTPPTYKAIMAASWKTTVVTETTSSSINGQQKRTISQDGTAHKLARKEVSYYQPPSGKFSVKVDTYKEPAYNVPGRGNGTFSRRGVGNRFRSGRW